MKANPTRLNDRGETPLQHALRLQDQRDGKGADARGMARLTDDLGDRFARAFQALRSIEYTSEATARDFAGISVPADARWARMGHKSRNENE